MFVLPIILCLIIMEKIVVMIPNSYSYKNNFIKENGNQIEAIAIGHSQLYDGFNPKYFGLKSFNLCNSAQSYKDDCYILEQLLPYMPNLKLVIMPIGYYEVTDVIASENDLFNDRSSFYYEYMGIDYGGNLPFKNKFEICYPQRAKDKIISYYILHEDIIGCDSLGMRSTHKLKDRKYKLGTDQLERQYTCTSIDSFGVKHGKYLIKAIELLQNKSIDILLVSSPYYWKAFHNVNMEQKKYISKYIGELCEKYNVEYLNLESDTCFKTNDFFNETHLSEYGAELFTKKLNEYVMNKCHQHR